MSQFTADPDGKSYGCQLCTAAGRSGIRIEVFSHFDILLNCHLDMFISDICLNDSDLKGCLLGQGFEEFEGTLSAQVGLCFKGLGLFFKGLDGKSFFSDDNFFKC